MCHRLGWAGLGVAVVDPDSDVFDLSAELPRVYPDS
jgi:hypothetical protein